MAEAPLPGNELAQGRDAAGQPPLVPATGRDRGIGPFKRLVLRGATVIDGTGAPPIGPTDIVVEDGRITLLKKVTGASAKAGSFVDPQIAVSGDDADGTKAKWMMLSVNRKCDLK